MPYTKGKTKTGGRNKGTPNKTTGELREHLQTIVEGFADQVEKDLKGLPPRERVNLWLRLAEFVLPKLQRTEFVESDTSSKEKPVWIIEIPRTEMDEVRANKGEG